MANNLIEEYISYASASSEVPAIFHRWSIIAGIGAYLGRQYHFHHGHFTIYPNIYCMLIGSPGTRKSSAIKLMKKILLESGYNTIAADKTTKEKFLMDLAGEESSTGFINPDDLLEKNLFGEADENADSEVFVMADEFNDFFGNGNIEFISLLGTLWDYSGVYRNRIKNGKSLSINNPTVSILGGNTPTGFAMAFPTEIFGQGFFSRILLIYGEPNGKRIAFPQPPDGNLTLKILEGLRRSKTDSYGTADLSNGARELLERIYNSPRFAVSDVRFQSYSNRRFTHLIKLCLIAAAARYAKTIERGDVIFANTILHYAENLMPRALGEFGKSKHSDVSHKIIQLAEASYEVLTFKEIWKHVSNDLEKMADLSVLIQNLCAADKLQAVPGGKGFLAKRRVLDYVDETLIDYSLLTEEERKML